MSKSNVTRKDAKRLRQRGKGLISRSYFMAGSNLRTTETLRDWTPEEIEAGEVIPETKEPMHIDTFIDFGTDSDQEEHEDYARWLFNHWRLPAINRCAFDKFMSEHKLFCMYQGEKWRVTGASRLGDVWLTKNFEQDCGYQARVMVEDCSKWGKD